MPFPASVTPRALLCCSDLIHLRYSLHELVVLAFFVGVSFGLGIMSTVPSAWSADYLPHISMAYTRSCVGICSVVLGDWRNCLCMLTVASPLTFLLLSLDWVLLPLLAHGSIESDLRSDVPSLNPTASLMLSATVILTICLDKSLRAVVSECEEL